MAKRRKTEADADTASGSPINVRLDEDVLSALAEVQELVQGQFSVKLSRSDLIRNCLRRSLKLMRKDPILAIQNPDA